MTSAFSFEVLRCPQCKVGRLAGDDPDGSLVCLHCDIRYPVSTGRPILLRPDNPVFRAADYLTSKSQGTVSPRAWARLIPSPSVNLSRQRVLGAMRAQLDAKGACTILVVGGGRQRAWLSPLMQGSRPPRLVYSDVDAGADVDIFCDAHDLPFADEAFDAVITTAVLEHVLYPEQVAGEIARIVTQDGMLYSELPFMQQVHEGAYDFTRYTLSGHRRLFRQFAQLESGMTSGPGTALVWAIENFTLAFFTRPFFRTVAKAGARIAFFWLKYFDYLLERRPAAMDGASCTFFLGIRTSVPVSDEAIIASYRGAKHMQGR
jgi:SAM-dependent methyltransferase/uncharacterized protein YbaR (Trm112 family)